MILPDIASIIQNSTLNPWLYLPAAVLLGALHALEPGHSKSMMAAFIVSVHGTPRQAALLGVSAAIGHTLVVWLLAFLGLYFGSTLFMSTVEPWLTFASGILIIMLSLRIFLMLRGFHTHSHSHGHSHGHDHEHHHHDDHAAAHAQDIQKHFANKQVTNFDIAWFGFTGGLLPCPAAIAVLLICLQLKKFTLGIGLVAAFSVGLAITLVSIGILASWGAKAATKRWAGLETFSHRIPYVSAALVFTIGAVITLQGLTQLGFL